MSLKPSILTGFLFAFCMTHVVFAGDSDGWRRLHDAFMFQTSACVESPMQVFPTLE